MFTKPKQSSNTSTQAYRIIKEMRDEAQALRERAQELEERALERERESIWHDVDSDDEDEDEEMKPSNR